MTQTNLPVKVLYIIFIKIVINQVILKWPSYKSEVSCIGLALGQYS